MSDEKLLEVLAWIEQEYMSVRQAAAKLGMSERGLRHVLTTGYLEAVQVRLFEQRPMWLIRPENVEAFRNSKHYRPRRGSNSD